MCAKRNSSPLLRAGRPRALDNTPGRGQTPGNTAASTSKGASSGGEIMKTNYLAVFVCAVVYWLIGGLWYGYLFTKPWTSLEGPASASVNPVLPYIVTFVLNLLIAFVLAQVCIWRNANTASRGSAVGILLWLGIVGPITFTTYMYEGRPLALYAINEFYPLVGLCVMGAILGVWKKKAA